MTNEEYGMIKGYKQGLVDDEKVGKLKLQKEFLSAINIMIANAETSKEIYILESARDRFLELADKEKT